MSASKERIAEKMAHLLRSGEAKDRRQAYAMAVNMERAGRLRAGGVYVPVKR